MFLRIIRQLLFSWRRRRHQRTLDIEARDLDLNMDAYKKVVDDKGNVIFIHSLIDTSQNQPSERIDER